MTETTSPDAAAGALAAVDFLRRAHYSSRGYADAFASSESDHCAECYTPFPCDVVDALNKYAAEPGAIHDECRVTAADLAAAVAGREEAEARAAQSLATAVQAVRGQLGVNRDATDKDVQEASEWRSRMEAKLASSHHIIWSLQTDNGSLAGKASEARADRDEALTIVDDALRADRAAQAAGAPDAERLATMNLILNRP